MTPKDERILEQVLKDFSQFLQEQEREESRMDIYMFIAAIGCVISFVALAVALCA